MTTPDLEPPELTTADRLRVAATCGTAVTISAERAWSIASYLDVVTQQRRDNLDLARSNLDLARRLQKLIPVYFAAGVIVGSFLTFCAALTLRWLS